jgi:T-complex protein 1 subunit gamma
VPVDVNKSEEVIKIIKSCIGTKFVSKWSDLACKIALEAVSTVQMEENGRKEIDIKRYAKIEKVCGSIEREREEDIKNDHITKN